MMMTSHDAATRQWQNVLVGTPPGDPHAVWYQDLDQRLAAEQVSLRRAATSQETIALVEAGGLDVAVLWADGRGAHGLRLLEIIRSLTPVLPCLLVTPDTGVLTMRRALELQAYSVIRQPVETTLLADLLVKILRKRSRNFAVGRQTMPPSNRS
jgi:DNA-binding NtrC family response regulator